MLHFTPYATGVGYKRPNILHFTPCATVCAPNLQRNILFKVIHAHDHYRWVEPDKDLMQDSTAHAVSQ